MNRLLTFFFMCLTVLVSPPSQAAPDAVAFAHFVDGDFETAAEIAAAIGDAENLSLAARALNAKAYLITENKPSRKMAKKALKLAERAISQDEMLVEGHLQAAISFAQRATRMAPIRAFVSGAAGKTRERLDRALELEPQNPWALSTSGAWHLEVSRSAGDGRFGADAATGYQQLIAARMLAPDNLSIAYECALRFLTIDDPAWRDEALVALEAAVALEPANALETALQMRAKTFLAAIEAGKEMERAFIDAQP